MVGVIPVLGRFLPLAVSVLFIPHIVHSESIGLFSDSNCSSCNLSIPIGETKTFYVSGPISPTAPLQSYEYVEFRIEGLPAGWTYQVQPTAAVGLVIGNPLGDGVNASISVTSNCTTFFEVEVTATTQETGQFLTVEHHESPASPGFNCPNYTLCTPCDILRCVAGGTLQINSGETCHVGISQSTWGSVKALYLGE